MTFPEFDKLFDGIVAECTKMRDTKGREYANSEADRLANFKEIAAKFGVTGSLVCSVYLEKHMRSIQSRVRIGTTLSNETVRGRIVDAITYLALLAALLHEEENDGQQEGKQSQDERARS